jgi:hypothetical protein
MSKFKKNLLGGRPFTTIPDQFLAQTMAELSHSELRAMLYIFLHTLGYGKLEDAISYEQFINGITTREGVRLDHGAGIKRRALVTALAALERKGLISRHHQANAATAVIRLKLPAAPHDSGMVAASQGAEGKISEAEVPVSAAKENSPVKHAVDKEQTLHLGEATEMQSLPETVVKEVQNLHPTCKNQKHESHDGVAAADFKSAVEFLIQNIADLQPKEAERLVRIALVENKRDLAYLQNLIDYVTSNPTVRVPAAVLTVLIQSNQDRTLAGSTNRYAKYQSAGNSLSPDRARLTYPNSGRGDKSKSGSKKKLDFGKKPKTPTLPAISDKYFGEAFCQDAAQAEEFEVSDSTALIPEVNSLAEPFTGREDTVAVDGRLKFSLQEFDAKMAAYVKRLEMREDVVTVKFMGSFHPTDLTAWLPQIQIYYPEITKVVVV